MATKVYLSGDVVYVKKTATADLLIPQARAKYTFIAPSPTELNPVPDFTSVKITDIATDEDRDDLVSNIQDSGGTPIGAYDDVKAYFEGFMFRGDFQFVPSALDVTVTGSATAAKQDEQTALLEDILADLGKVEFFSNVALGRVTGAKNWKKTGENTAVSTTQLPLNEAGSAIVPLTVAATISFVSTSANDTVAGTGARYIRIFGVNSSGAEIQEDLALNGTTPVTTINSYYGILNRVIVIQVGSGATKSNQGTITGTSGGNTYCTITIGDSIMKQLAYYVPTNKTALIYSYIFDASKNAGTNVVFDVFFYVLQGGVRYDLFSFKIDQANGIDNSSDRTYKSPLPIPQGCLWWAECKVSAGTATLTAEVEQIIFDNI